MRLLLPVLLTASVAFAQTPAPTPAPTSAPAATPAELQRAVDALREGVRALTARLDLVQGRLASRDDIDETAARLYALSCALAARDLPAADREGAACDGPAFGAKARPRPQGVVSSTVRANGDVEVATRGGRVIAWSGGKLGRLK